MLLSCRVQGIPRSVARIFRCCRAKMGLARAASIGAPMGALVLTPDRYPKTRRDESTVEDLHGTQVADPYRWLEDPDSEETKHFVEAQNLLTQSVLKECETINNFKKLFTKLYDYPKYSCPRRRGKRYHYSFNSGLQSQSVLYSQADLDSKETVLLDPNKLSEDGTVALSRTAFSKDGNFMAYALSSGGSDWVHIRILTIDQETGQAHDLEDNLEYVKFTSLMWTHDNKGFFYNKYPEPKKGELGTETDINLNQQLCYHVVGQPQKQDAVILACPDHPAWQQGAEVTDDGRFLLITISEGCLPTNQLWYVDLQALHGSEAEGALDFGPYDFRFDPKALPVVKLVDNFDAQYEYVANEGTEFTFQTNYKSPLYRLIRTDIQTPSDPSTWQDVIPEHSSNLLQWAAALKGDALIVCYLADAASRLQIHSLATGKQEQQVPLPGIGTVTQFAGRREDSEFFFAFSSYTEPGAIYRMSATCCRLDTKKPGQEPSLFRRAQLKGGYTPSKDFETKQVFASSKDGTKVPMFITHRKGLKLDGTAPTLLYGYGGFNISLTPSFAASRLAFMLGYNAVFAVANLRGGGEYGLKWHDAGTHGNKQNVFDDFQACAEYLSKQEYTKPSKLIINGGSNGGLLVAACANQRPDLFGAVICQVGVHDMLRFHKFTIGHAWTSDYGDPDKADAFAYLYPYSPIHNVRTPTGGSKQYPAMLITTGDHDDRVVPLHSHKLTAALQHELVSSRSGSAQTNPLITRIDVRAGHGAGKPTAKVIEEAAESFGFAAKAIDAQWVHSD